MARFEQGSIERASVETVRALGNDHAGALRADGIHDPVNVKRPVSRKPPEIRRLETGRNPDRVVMLAGNEGKAEQITQGISHGDDLR
ncbi:hypothetical protein MSKU9_0287 [Komagataeibacter diospyri]|uniref:Uncharacterized protein n=1 Tax=Komagataeibacter diospyri TaxID=1932662 RepID=A0A4P5NW53_9PROT|nr:hypothetical protein MSKU9_0287 [Komagataeibacter diospyri]